MSRDPVIDALGVAIRLDLAALGDGDAAAVRAAWAGAEADADASARLVVHVTPDGERQRWLGELSRRVTAAAIEHRKGEGWMLHAAALADPDGAVVAFVGESGAGKTTVAAELGRRFGYVTDETVFVGPGREVAAYRKPLSVRGGATAPRAESSPSSLGLGSLPALPLRLATIVLLDRRDDAVEPSARRLTTVDAIAALTAHTSFLSHLPRPLRFVAAIIDETPVVRLSYRDARDLEGVDALWRISVDTARSTAPETAAVFSRDAVKDAAGHPPNSGLRRAAVADAVAPGDGDRLVVLHDGVVRTLDGIAPTLWRALGGAGDRPVPVAALVAASVAVHGVPPEGDAEQFAAAALDELRAAGLVVAVGTGWRVAADCAWRDSVGGGIVALSLRGVEVARPLLLDEVGSLIWRALVSAPGAAAAQIGRIVARELLDPPRDLVDQVRAFIASLERSRLVDRV